jgi:hypothetical protein
MSWPYGVSARPRRSGGICLMPCAPRTICGFTSSLNWPNSRLVWRSASPRWLGPSPIPSPLVNWRGWSETATALPSISVGSSECSRSITSPLMPCGSSRPSTCWSRIRMSMTPYSGGSPPSMPKAASHNVSFRYCSSRPCPWNACTQSGGCPLSTGQTASTTVSSRVYAFLLWRFPSTPSHLLGNSCGHFGVDLR